jgi:LysR family hydrogen peroxide-inducible transcriptional activator
MITLKQLQYFSAVARLRHFGRAAEECHVSQPALSVQIQELESTLGATLIERRRNALALTQLGEEVHRRAHNILADVRDLTDFARHRPALLTGPLNLGVIPSIAPYLLPAVLPLLQSRFTRLELKLRESQTRMLVEELRDGRLDVALLSLPIHEPWVEQIQLFDDRFVLVTPASRAIPRRLPSAADLSGENLLLLEEGHCMRDQALTYCQAAHTGTHRQFGAASLATIVQMVANGYGSTLLPEIALPVEIRDNPAVSVHNFTAPEPKRTVGLIWRRTSPRKSDFIELGRAIVEAAAGIERNYAGDAV